jgi:hypothetical protein
VGKEKWRKEEWQSCTNEAILRTSWALLRKVVDNSRTRRRSSRGIFFGETGVFAGPAGVPEKSF